MNDEILLEEFKFSIDIKDYNRAYKVLRDMVRDDIIEGRFVNKTAMIVLYFEFLTKHNCYNELRDIYLKAHNKCVYYRRNGVCFGQKGAPKTKCKGDRRKCEQ